MGGTDLSLSAFVAELQSSSHSSPELSGDRKHREWLRKHHQKQQ